MEKETKQPSIQPRKLTEIKEKKYNQSKIKRCFLEDAITVKGIKEKKVVHEFIPENMALKLHNRNMLL